MLTLMDIVAIINFHVWIWLWLRDYYAIAGTHCWVVPNVFPRRAAIQTCIIMAMLVLLGISHAWGRKGQAPFSDVGWLLTSLTTLVLYFYGLRSSEFYQPR
ncbi:hypothetical protein [Paludisphaera rhizosphaerae]|uniref:hypothetical protein n=1 Tax=Paludisphaera rhizosphaerae TaxID=2711216 RepID=UPI0013EB16F9|nr:hypothetical protein [Paludisphaera rhizosphaerae]